MARNKEMVGELKGTPDVDRVIDSENTKLFRGQAVVLSRETLNCFLDLHGLAEVTLDLNGPVRVYGFDKKTVIGFANFRWEGDLLVSSITIDYSCPERLLLQVDETPLWLEPQFCLEENDLFFIESASLRQKCPDLDDNETPVARTGRD